MLHDRRPDAFADLCLSFGDDLEETPGRFGSNWMPAFRTPHGILATSVGSLAADLIVHTMVAGWSLWVLGDVTAYRSRAGSPVSAMAEELASNRFDPTQVDGRFLIVAHDGGSGTWHVITDRCGTLHGYIGRTGTQAVVTTFSPAAAVGDRTVDWEAVTGLCRLGFLPADRTWWTNVRILRPSTWLELAPDGGERRHRRWWTWAYQPQPRAREDMLEELDSVLRCLVDTEVDGHSVVLPLSGGLDSRLLAGVVGSLTEEELGPSVSGLTYGYGSTSVETSIGGQVATAGGIRCRTFQVRPYVLDEVDTLVDAFEGALSLTVPRQAGVSGEIAQLGNRVVGGHWGDVWLDTAGRPDTSQGLAAVALAKFRKRGSDWLVRHLCTPHLDRDPDVVVEELMRAEADRIPPMGDPDMELKALKTEQWSFRWTLASIRAYQLGAFPVLPFYEQRLVDVLLGVPAELHAGRALQIEWIRRRYPALARVPWQVTGHDLVGEPPGRARDAVERLGRKAGRFARRERVVERNWEVQLHAPAQLGRVRDLLVEGPIGELVGGDEIDQLVDQFASGVDAGVGYAVDLALSISEWLRRYG